jgi:putative two-component system response regulator
VLHIFTLTERILKKVMEKTDRYHIDKADIPLICNASALHDIGKISVPEAILNKPGKLTKEEFEIMKQHSAEGARLLSRIPQRENEALIQMGYQICRWHHERYDGSGYPDGLKGEEIPIAAQVVALADVYDALTSKRVYKDAYSHEKAVEMILNGECGVFNPLLLECLEELSDTLKKELNVVSTSTYYEREILNAVESMVERDNVEVSERTLRILERERIKNQFYARVSHEVEFEYTMTPELLVLSEWGATYLNIPQVIQKPGESVFTEQVFPKEEFTEFLDKMRHTTAEHPQMEENVLLMIHGQNVPCKVIARSMWTSENEPKYEGFIGKIVEQSI